MRSWPSHSNSAAMLTRWTFPCSDQEGARFFKVESRKALLAREALGSLQWSQGPSQTAQPAMLTVRTHTSAYLASWDHARQDTRVHFLRRWASKLFNQVLFKQGTYSQIWTS